MDDKLSRSEDLLINLKNALFELDLLTLDDEILVNKCLERSTSVLSIIESSLTYFIVVNFLGGFTDDPFDFNGCYELARKELSCEGEPPFKLAKSLTIFWICKRLCRKMCGVTKSLFLQYHLNLLKCIYLHQYLIGNEKSPQLKAEFIEAVNLIENELSLQNSSPCEDLALYYMLASYLCVYYYDYEGSHKFSSKCAELLKLDVSFTGLLGKRTRFQEHDFSNLFVEVHKPQLIMERKTETQMLPKIILLNDDTLLNSTSFSAAPGLPILSLLEQSYILLLCELHRLSHPRDELVHEQCLAYLNTIIRIIYPDSTESTESIPSSWPIATETLFKRSLLELNSVRKTERALSQLEELANQFYSKEPSFLLRSTDSFFLTRMPSIWVLQIQQAHLLMKIGCHKSALDIFLRWDQWSEIIQCYTGLNKREKAKEVICSRLNAGEESAELYCALGDVTNDRQHYFKAWEVSRHQSARAMRSLAIVYMYIDKDYPKAIECFEKSLHINNMQVNIWFTFGCCCLQSKEYIRAEKAFRECVRLEPDNFEAWNNCATAVLLQGRKSIALNLMKEACKHNYENWHIWENILLISVDVESFLDTIQAYHRLLDLRDKYCNTEALNILVKAVENNVNDINGLPAVRLRSKLLELFVRVTILSPMNPDVWNGYANLLVSEKPNLSITTYERAVQCLQNAHRGRVQPSQGDWEKSPDKRTSVANGLKAWAELLNKKPDISGENSADNCMSNEQLDAFVQTSLISLRLSLNVVISKLKRAEENSVTFDAQESIRNLNTELKGLYRILEQKLNT